MAVRWVDIAQMTAPNTPMLELVLTFMLWGDPVVPEYAVLI